MNIYPKNKQLFKELIPYTKKIIKLLTNRRISVVIYGSFAHFYYTGDKQLKVNDIDLLIQKKDFKSVIKILAENEIKFKHYPEWPGIIIKKGKLKIEIDAIGEGYRTLNEKSFKKQMFNSINFYGMRAKMITLKHLEEIYPVAYVRSKEDKVKLLKKLKHLEKFLGRKLK